MKHLFVDLMRFHPLRKIGALLILGVAVHLVLPQITALEHSWQVLNMPVRVPVERFLRADPHPA